VDDTHVSTFATDGTGPAALNIYRIVPHAQRILSLTLPVFTYPINTAVVVTTLDHTPPPDWPAALLPDPDRNALVYALVLDTVEKTVHLHVPYTHFLALFRRAAEAADKRDAASAASNTAPPAAVEPEPEPQSEPQPAAENAPMAALLPPYSVNAPPDTPATQVLDWSTWATAASGVRLQHAPPFCDDATVCSARLLSSSVPDGLANCIRAIEYDPVRARRTRQTSGCVVLSAEMDEVEETAYAVAADDYEEGGDYKGVYDEDEGGTNGPWERYEQVRASGEQGTDDVWVDDDDLLLLVKTPDELDNGLLRDGADEIARQSAAKICAVSERRFPHDIARTRRMGLRMKWTTDALVLVPVSLS
jgi:hypothetical protein